MEKRERGYFVAATFIYREKRCAARLYNNKFSATLYRKTEKGEKRMTTNKYKSTAGRFNSKQCFGIQRRTTFALPSSIF
jgi:hypothetical protein